MGLAQSVTTMWPYKYSDFRKGTVFLKNQQTISTQLNIHLLKSTLHYLEGDKIKEVKSDDIEFVLIDNIIQDTEIPDKYYMCNDQLMRVANGDSTAFIAELILVDFSRLKESGGAYGSSSNVQSTSKMSSLPIGGVGSTMTNHVELKSKKDGGTLLPIEKKYFIIIGDTIYTATGKGVESKLSAAKKAEFKQFTKKNKINWKDSNSLARVMEFLKN